jgi:hypothetical protein
MPPSPQVDRRRFLGMVGGSVALGRLLIDAPARSGEDVPAAPRRVGVLLPRSAGGRWSSLRHGMAVAAVSVDPVDIMVQELGGAGQGLAEGVEHLLGPCRAECIIAYVDARLAASLEQLVAGRAPMIVSGGGACLPTVPATAESPWTCTTEHWRTAYALGRWCAQPGHTVACVASLYEAGYDGLYAFQLGVEDGGSSCRLPFVWDAPGRSATPDQVVAALRAASVHAIYIADSEPTALPLLRALAHAATPAGWTIMVNPCLLQHGDARCLPADGLFTASSYDPALDSETNHAFVAAFQARTGGLPDERAALGCDLVHLARSVAMSGGRCPHHALLASSPRGELLWDPLHRTVRAPIYLSHLRSTHQGIVREVLCRLDSITEDDRRLVALQRGLRSGWTNPYPSVAVGVG